MTTITVEEDLHLANSSFKTKKELFEYLLWEYEDIALWKEMEEILKNSQPKDFLSYEDFMLKYKY